MIIIGGKPYRTLADPIYTNGKRVQKVFVNGKQAYPEVYEKPAIGASGNVLKIRGKHTSVYDLYSNGVWWHTWDSSYAPPYNASIKCTISYAAYIRAVPYYDSQYEHIFALENDKELASYLRAKNLFDVDPKYDGDVIFYTACNCATYASSEDMCRFTYTTEEDKGFYANKIKINDKVYPSPSFCKVVFKVQIDPFYIPDGRETHYNHAYPIWKVEPLYKYFDNHCKFNNKIFTIYTRIDNDDYSTNYSPVGIASNVDASAAFYIDADGKIKYHKNTGDNINDIDLLGICFRGGGLTTGRIGGPDRACPFSIEAWVEKHIKNAAIYNEWSSKNEHSVIDNMADYSHSLGWSTFGCARCSPEEIIYLGDEIDSKTGEVVPLITKEDLIDFDGSEEIIEPIIDGLGPIKIDEYEYPIEVKTDKVKINAGDFFYKESQYSDMASVINRVDYKANYLTTIDGQNVTKIDDYGFYQCRRLIYASFPNLTTIGKSAFYKCTGLIIADFPLLLSIGDGCFCNDVALKYIDFPNVSTTENGAFMYCYSLTSANFPACNNIGINAFRSCYSLSFISFPACTTIKDYAFTHCSSLTEASFPVCTSIGSYAFWYCSSLTSVSFPVCTSIGSCAFGYCSLLTEADFPACSYIGYHAFEGCSSLTSINFPACINIGGQAFDYRYMLTEANFPACKYVGYRAFRSCSSLTEANFPACTSIESNAFYNCSSLTEASFPVCTTIGIYAFKGCITLPSVTLPSVTYIGSQAFAGCTGLTTVTLGKMSIMSRNTIGSSVFANCPNLSSLYLLYKSRSEGCRLLASYASTIFGDSTILDGTCKIYIPSETYSFYMSNWSQFASQIVSITS